MGLVPSRLPAPLAPTTAPALSSPQGDTPMDRHSVQWSGPMPAVVTPFNAAGRVDEAAFTANVERLLAAGATGIVAGGCTGEFWALSVAERAALYGLAVRAVGGRGTVLVGPGAVTQQAVIE